MYWLKYGAKILSLETNWTYAKTIEYSMFPDKILGQETYWIHAKSFQTQNFLVWKLVESMPKVSRLKIFGIDSMFPDSKFSACIQCFQNENFSNVLNVSTESFCQFNKSPLKIFGMDSMFPDSKF